MPYVSVSAAVPSRTTFVLSESTFVATVRPDSCHQSDLLISRLVLLVILLGCSGKAAHSPMTLPACANGTRRWPLASAGDVRPLRVWIDTRSQSFDGWGPYGWRRLRLAMAEWNVIRLPLRFVEARSLRESDIVVDVLESIPGQDRGDRDQAGVTSLTYEVDAIIRARVFIAISAPFGVRYSVADQQANLVHELGHALGLPHAAEAGAVMAPRRVADELTGADIALARSHYGCDPRRP